MDKANLQRSLSRIPAVDQLLLRPAVASWADRTSREFVVTEIQNLLRGLRDAVRSGDPGAEAGLSPERLEQALLETLRRRLQPSLRAVINATGVILHTNLGRAPLSAAAQETLSAFSAGYTNLEYEISEGRRSHRDKLIEPLLTELLGCEAATVVNNNAAAVFLILNTLACGREVVVSRGELVEIGGSFRIPDIMAQSGATLREVGTTNKTRLSDYQAAIGPDTAMLLRVHTSNFRMVGFTEKPGLDELVALARSVNIPLVEDIGSGCLADLRPYGLSEEPLAGESLAAGASLVCFSGDKLLGGPQAGVIAGARALVDPIRRNPMMRTYRVEKLIYGALEATLLSYRAGRAAREIPVLRMISVTREEAKRRAQGFARRLRREVPASVRVGLRDGHSLVGGGSCPEYPLPTTLVALECDSPGPGAIGSRVRLQDPSIVVRVEEDRVLIDLRTVFPAEERALLEGLAAAVRAR